MNKGTLFWMIVFATFAFCFFTVAAIVSVKGFKDLKDLLRSTKQGGTSEE
jgi:hypothetical protein